MSASEKLKALDGQANERPWWTERADYGQHLLGQCGPDDYVTLAEGYPVKPPATNNLDVIASLRNALPQIVAVVEAAETNLPIYDAALIASGMNTTPNKMLFAALSALEEALSNA